MKGYDFVSGLFLTAVSAGASLMAYRLGVGTVREPGPGLIPLGTAALLGLMSIGLVMRSLFQGTQVSKGEKIFQGIRWKTNILVFCALLGYGMAFDALGFSLCTFLFIVLLLGVVGRKKWWWTLGTSILIVVVTYFIFVVWLGCEFPRGFLGV